MGKYVYSFKEADYRNKKLFGGKGASLIQMSQLGLRVPRVRSSTSLGERKSPSWRQPF